MAIGFRVRNRSRVVDRKWVEKFKELPVANVSDSMHRMYAGGAQLRPMHRSGKLAGRAITVKAPPGDNLMLHKAMDMAVDGDDIGAWLVREGQAVSYGSDYEREESTARKRKVGLWAGSFERPGAWRQRNGPHGS